MNEEFASFYQHHNYCKGETFMSIKKREVVSHPSAVKLISVITALFMLGTFAVNGYVMLSGYMLNWGFYPDKTTPNIQTSYDNVTHNVAVYVPFYVINTGAIGFDVVDLRADFTITNSSGIVATSVNGPWTVPYGGNLTAKIGLMVANNETLYNILSAGPIAFNIDFHVSYAFSTTSIAVKIDFPGGLTFP